MHKNGTKGLLTYRLDEGVRVYWDFAYYEGEGVWREVWCSPFFFSLLFLFLSFWLVDRVTEGGGEGRYDRIE